MVMGRLHKGSASQLVSDGQAANPLPRCGKDRVAQRGSERWYADLPDTAGGLPALDDVDARVPRRDVHARHLEIVEVVLPDPTLAERDLAVEGRAHGHDGCALHLRANPVRKRGEAA